MHTVRAVGGVTRALCSVKEGDSVGLRGPFGNSWPLDVARGGDVVVIAGGIGLAPLRPLVYELLRSRASLRRLTLLYGTRTPADIVFRSELEAWSARLDTDVEVTVDSADASWHGHAGVVTRLVPRADIDPERTTVFICGPEIMMKYCVRELARTGLPDERVYVSLERSMKCGIGLCGHCQLGSQLLCRDGPIYRWDRVRDLVSVKEL